MDNFLKTANYALPIASGIAAICCFLILNKPIEGLLFLILAETQNIENLLRYKDDNNVKK